MVPKIMWFYYFERHFLQTFSSTAHLWGCNGMLAHTPDYSLTLWLWVWLWLWHTAAIQALCEAAIVRLCDCRTCGAFWQRVVTSMLLFSRRLWKSVKWQELHHHHHHRKNCCQQLGCFAVPDAACRWRLCQDSSGLKRLQQPSRPFMKSEFLLV